MGCHALKRLSNLENTPLFGTHYKRVGIRIFYYFFNSFKNKKSLPFLDKKNENFWLKFLLSFKE